MNIQTLINGNLEMSATKKEQRQFKKNFSHRQSISESQFIRDILASYNYTEILPEECGALTSAPLITDGTNVWGYMDYQVRSFIEELYNGNTIIFQKG